MKTELSKIAQDFEQGTITEDKARTLLLGLLSVSGSLPTDNEIEFKAIEMYKRKDGKINRGGSFLGFLKGAKWLRDLLMQ